MVIAKKLQEFTLNLRKGQRDYLTKIKQIHGVETNRDDEDEEDYDEELEMDQIEKIQNKRRNKEIQDLADSIKDIAVLFKELSTLVIEQGTIIDRIDYNIEQSLESTKKGKKHLVSARKAQKSNRARKMIY